MQFIAFQTVSSTEARKQIVKEGNLFPLQTKELLDGWSNKIFLISYPNVCGLLLGIIQGHDYKRL